MKIARKLLVYFVSAFALIVGVSYLNYRNHGLSRNIEDRTIHRLTRAQNGDRVHTIVLSDSVTRTAAQRYVPEQGVELYTTIVMLRLAGQYALLRRYLESNSPKQVYLFTLGDEFWHRADHDKDKSIRYTYVDTVFWNWHERVRLKQADDQEPFWRSYFYDVMLKSWRSKLRDMPEPSRSQFVPGRAVTPEIGHEMLAQFDGSLRARTFLEAKFDLQNQIVMRDFDTLCAERKMNCTIVIEPLPIGNFEKGGTPFWRKDIDFSVYKNLKIIDLNYEGDQLINWPNHAFPDGIHFAPHWYDHYLATINRRVGPLFKTGAQWDGAFISTSQAHGKLEFYQFFQSEDVGRWLSNKEGLIEFTSDTLHQQPITRLRIDGRSKSSPEFPLRVDVKINGTPIGSLSYNKNWDLFERELNVPKGLLKPGRNVISLQSAAAYASDTDPRKLGFLLVNLGFIQ
jgi:hypothetical protein